jgi:N-acetylglucosaminyldiphosphoundecaprenol N-acetyl-beta-D-mannosaminyltransferase
MKHTLFNVKIDVYNYEETIQFCVEALKKNKCKIIYFLNAHCFNIAQNNEEYREALNSVDLLLNDGIGIEIASKLAKVKLKDNMNGTDFIPKIMELSSKNNYKVYLLGGKGDVPCRAKEKLEKLYPGIKIVGVHDGYFDEKTEKSVIGEINNEKVDILVVGMGVPKQELWLHDNKHKFTHVKLGIAGGAILDFISGNVTRAPRVIRRLRLEWAYRLFKEPRRLWRRYVIGNVLFLIHITLFKLGLKNKNM